MSVDTYKDHHVNTGTWVFKKSIVPSVCRIAAAE